MTDEPSNHPTQQPERSHRNKSDIIRLYGFSLFGILLFALSPVASVALAYLIASPAGCEVNEAAVHPCVIVGIDFGGMLNIMVVLGWLMIGTIPVGAVLLTIWAFVLIGHLIQIRIHGRRHRRKSLRRWSEP